jgi:hypothetical protein
VIWFGCTSNCCASSELAQTDEQRGLALIEIAAGHRVTGDIEHALDALAQADPLAEALGYDAQRSNSWGSLHSRGGSASST